MMTLLHGFKVVYLGLFWKKSWVGPTHPTPIFYHPKRGHYPKFSIFSSEKKIFQKMRRKNFFLPKDAQRVTCHCTKRFGVRGAFPHSQKNKKHFTLQNGRFWNNPQISFWPIGCRGCVGARQKFHQKKLQTLEILFDTLVIAQRPEFIDLWKLGNGPFFFPVTVEQKLHYFIFMRFLGVKRPI